MLIGYSKARGLITKLDSVDDFYMDVMLDSRSREVGQDPWVCS